MNMRLCGLLIKENISIVTSSRNLLNSNSTWPPREHSSETNATDMDIILRNFQIGKNNEIGSTNYSTINVLKDNFKILTLWTEKRISWYLRCISIIKTFLRHLLLGHCRVFPRSAKICKLYPEDYYDAFKFIAEPLKIYRDFFYCFTTKIVIPLKLLDCFNLIFYQ